MDIFPLNDKELDVLDIPLDNKHAYKGLRDKVVKMQKWMSKLIENKEIKEDKLSKYCDHYYTYETRKDVLSKQPEEYIKWMHIDNLIALRDLFLKLQLFISGSKLGIQNRDLIREVEVDKMNNFINVMEESGLWKSCQSTCDLFRFPKTKNVTCYEFETQEKDVVWNMICSFQDLDPNTILESHILSSSQKYVCRPHK